MTKKKGLIFVVCVWGQIGGFWYKYGVFVMIMTNYIYRWCGPEVVNICGYTNVYVDKEL